MRLDPRSLSVYVVTSSRGASGNGHLEIAAAAVAERAGADYLGVTVFSTSTKPDARPIGLDGLSQIVAATSIPVVGIGGIDAANARDVLAAGAVGVAVISVVADADDPIAAVGSLVDAVKRAGATR